MQSSSFLIHGCSFLILNSSFLLTRAPAGAVRAPHRTTLAALGLQQTDQINVDIHAERLMDQNSMRSPAGPVPAVAIAKAAKSSF